MFLKTFSNFKAFKNYKMTKYLFLVLFFCRAFTQNSDLERLSYNKILPYGFEEEVLEVLKHYPELKDTYIKFKFKKLPDAIMQTQPTLLSLVFRKKNNRKYIVYINIIPSADALLEEFPKNAIQGILAHELAHICYYMKRSNLQLISDFIRYPINCPFKKQFERNTDIIAIEHGLGKKLKEAWQYTGYDAKLPDVFKAKKRFYYLSPLEIEEKMKELSQNHP